MIDFGVVRNAFMHKKFTNIVKLSNFCKNYERFVDTDIAFRTTSCRPQMPQKSPKCILHLISDQKGRQTFFV
eukprot:UN12344